MASYPYTSNPSRVKEFLKTIQGVGIPQKVTLRFVEQLGYKGKNDRNIPSVLKAIGFVDASGSPTALWQKFRSDDTAKTTMAQALRSAYAPLFATYSDAYRRDQEALRNFFSAHTSVGDSALRYMAGTFKALSELADFEAAPATTGGRTPQVNGGETADRQGGGGGAASNRGGSGSGDGNAVTININVQLQIPDTQDADTYDRFFAAMKKHLLS